MTKPMLPEVCVNATMNATSLLHAGFQCCAFREEVKRIESLTLRERPTTNFLDFVI
jgi:hypothetical protein